MPSKATGSANPSKY